MRKKGTTDFEPRIPVNASRGSRGRREYEDAVRRRTFSLLLLCYCFSLLLFLHYYSPSIVACIYIHLLTAVTSSTSCPLPST